MPNRREQFGQLLRTILGSEEVYFQRPESKKMDYPAIVYELSDIPNLYANDGVYLSGRQYSVTIIDKDPDSIFVGMIAELPTSSFDRHFRADNLNHWVFTIFY